MSLLHSSPLHELLPAIRARANQIDEVGDWPAEDLAALAEVGAMRWALPEEFGGDALSPLQLHLNYEMIASASLTTALVLSQRDSGIGMLVNAEPSPLRSELLCQLARNHVWTTIGIAQLTTSRQRGAPALSARRNDDGLIVNGTIPWATGASQCDFICSGALLEDGSQVLFTLPTDAPGVHVGPPLPLVALRGSHTCAVVCGDVPIPPRQILIPRSDSAGRKGVPIGQAFLALGLANNALELMGQIDSDASRQTQQRFAEQISGLRKRVVAHCSTATPAVEVGPALRGQSIDLALRGAHAAVTLFKGGGLLEGHPAQRLARETLFLLVWSCPAPVAECTLDLLSRDPA